MQINSGMISSSPFKTRRKKFGVGSLIIFLVMGVAFTGIGLAIYRSAEINTHWTRIEGTVTGVNDQSTNNGTTYAPIVSYKVNGEAYQITSSSSSSSYPATGSLQQIAYDPSNPADAKVVSSGTIMALLLIFPVVGIFLIVLAPILFVRSLRRSEDIQTLKQTGQKVQGVITDIQSTVDNANNSGSRNYRISVTATGPNGNIQTYLSDWLSGIGGLAMADFRTNPIAMDVYVNPSNPQDYYVDISEVPTMSSERVMELIQHAKQNYAPTSINPVQLPGQQPAYPQPTVSPVPQSQPGQDQNQYPPQTT